MENHLTGGIDAIDGQERLEGDITAADKGKVDVVLALRGHPAGQGQERRGAIQARGSKQHIPISSLPTASPTDSLKGLPEAGELEGTIVSRCLLDLPILGPGAAGGLLGRRLRDSVGGGRRLGLGITPCGRATDGCFGGRAHEPGEGDDDEDDGDGVRDESGDGAPAGASCALPLATQTTRARCFQVVVLLGELLVVYP